MQFLYAPVPRLEGPVNEALWPDPADKAGVEELRTAGRTALTEHLEAMKAGIVPAVTIDRWLVDYVLGATFVESVERLVSEDMQFEPRREKPAEAASCFDALNGLLGEVPRGRILNHVSDQQLLAHDPSYNDGIVHMDSFNGISVHVQRWIIDNSVRDLTIGLRRSEPNAGRIPFDSVEDGATKPTIWRGRLRYGDVTLLNSGLWVPDGDFLKSVHRFMTDYPLAQLGQPTSSFSQFIENWRSG